MGNTSTSELSISAPQHISPTTSSTTGTNKVLSDYKPDEDGVYKCECGFATMHADGILHHKESTSPFGKCGNLAMDHVTGWSTFMMNSVPYTLQSQHAPISRAKPNGLFTVITLSKDWDITVVTGAISFVAKDTAEINLQFGGDIVSCIGVEHSVWTSFDPHPPKGFMAFPEKKAKDSGKVLFPSNTGGHLILFVKGTRVDLLYELSKRLAARLGDAAEIVDRTTTFAYLPTTNYTPNLGRDLTGFIDGTRNPDHLLRALVDEVLIFPSDDSQRHVGGCFMYAGKFVHDLKKFNALSLDIKNHIVGRKYDAEQKHQGYDTRPENPRLDQDEYRSKHVRDSQPAPNRFHTNRAHGAIYRQSMPFIQGINEGLFFVAFTRYLEELENAINRMCGHFQPDGSIDAIFEITNAITSGYYYVPSLHELEILPLAKKLTPSDEMVQDTTQTIATPPLKVVIEYCTNCGYKTIFLEKKKVIESLVPGVQFIINPKMPRLASFEIYLEDGTVIFSKLAQPNGMNNYPECFPTNSHIVKRFREILKQPDLPSQYDDPTPEKWGQTHWV